jgi:hypothetical protein
MTRVCWWLVDRLSLMLEPDERDAVRGDFAETGVGGAQALRETLGLVARRQALLWKDWRPWLALLGLVVPVGWMLTLRAFALSLSLAIPLWATLHFGLGYPALTTGEQILLWAGDSVLVPALSWTAGFVLGSLSRRTAWLHGALFCLLCLLFNTHAAHYLQTQQMIFALVFEAVLFFFPAILGVRQGLRRGTSGARRAILLSASIMISITSLFIAADLVHTRIARAASAGVWLPTPFLPVQLLPLAVVSGPVVYMVAAQARASFRRR